MDSGSDTQPVLPADDIFAQHSRPLTRAQLALAIPSAGNLHIPFTSFIGRQREKAQLEQMLSAPTTRLLTLAGPGGCGKTRLALEVAHSAACAFVQGTWWVDLAPLVDPTLVPHAA